MDLEKAQRADTVLVLMESFQPRDRKEYEMCRSLCLHYGINLNFLDYSLLSNGDIYYLCKDCDFAELREEHDYRNNPLRFEID